MALGDPITGGSNVQATLIYNLAKSGWTESYNINVGIGSTNPLISAAKAMRRIIELRNPILPGDINVEALRVEYITGNGKADINYPPDYGLGVGGAILQSAPPELCWQVQVANDDFWSEQARFYHGWIPAMLPFNAFGVIGIAPPNPVKNWSLAMQDILRSSNSYEGGVCQFALKSFIRPGASVVYPKFDVDTVALDLSGNIEVTALTAAIGGLVRGDTLMLHVTRKRCVNGISGRWRIKAIRPSGDVNTVLTLAHKPCCAAAADLEDIKGTAQVFKPAFYQIRHFNLGRQANKKVGRAFFVARGRRRAVCC